MTQHTPTPWKVAETKPGNLTSIWRNDPGKNPGNTGYARIAQHVSPDDAAYIVRACNAHDELVMAAELALNIPGLGLQARRTIEAALKLAREE